MTQLATEITPVAPLKSRPAYLGFLPGTTRADARAGFYRKFGYMPLEVKIHYIVMAGPIQEADNE